MEHVAGTSLNGPSLNGTSLNGTSLSRTSLNGTSLNGPRQNVVKISILYMPNFEDHWTNENEDILRSSILELYNHMFTENLNRDMTKIEEDKIYDNMKKEYLKYSDDDGAILDDTVQNKFHRASKQYVERFVNSLRNVSGGKKN